eukprot:4193917-Pyramimonas_sp.AAC.1
MELLERHRSSSSTQEVSDRQADRAIASEARARRRTGQGLSARVAFDRQLRNEYSLAIGTRACPWCRVPFAGKSACLRRVWAVATMQPR